MKAKSRLLTHLAFAVVVVVVAFAVLLLSFCRNKYFPSIVVLCFAGTEQNRTKTGQPKMLKKQE